MFHEKNFFGEAIHNCKKFIKKRRTFNLLSSKPLVQKMQNINFKDFKLF